MALYKVIDSESYESVSKYLNYFENGSERMLNPYAFVTTDNNKYMVTKVDDYYAMVYEENGKLTSSGYIVDTSDNTRSYLTENKNYSIDDMGRYTINTDSICSSIVITNTDTSEREPIIVYSQDNRPYYRNHDNKSFHFDEVDYRYNASGHENPKTILNYLNSRSPEAINLCKIRGLIVNIKKYINDSGTYKRFYRVSDNIVRINNLAKSYSKDDMYKIIESKGFRSDVPKDLITFSNGTNLKVNEIDEVVRTYKAHNK